jgi:hypothetical protein
VLQVWQSLLSVRQLLLPMEQDVDTWLKFASLCRKNGRNKQAHRTLVALLGGCVACGACGGAGRHKPVDACKVMQWLARRCCTPLL